MIKRWFKFYNKFKDKNKKQYQTKNKFQQRIMFPQFVLLANPQSEYDQMYKKIMKNSRFDHHVQQVHNKQILDLNLDQKYLDSQLSQKSLKFIQEIKHKLFKISQFDTVIVAPLKKSLQTCYELFKHQSQQYLNKSNKQNIQFHIEPLLCDRINSTHAIGNFTQSKYPKQYQQYTNFFHQFKQKIDQPCWIYDILPKRIINELPNNTVYKSAQQYFKLLKATSNKTNHQQKYCFQTQAQFAQRILNLKQSLLNYQKISQSNKKILIIASSQVLNHLAATDYHQNGQPVNPLRLSPGDIQTVHLVINGIQTILQLDNQSILPFCR